MQQRVTRLNGLLMTIFLGASAVAAAFGPLGHIESAQAFDLPTPGHAGAVVHLDPFPLGVEALIPPGGLVVFGGFDGLLSPLPWHWEIEFDDAGAAMPIPFGVFFGGAPLFGGVVGPGIDVHFDVHIADLVELGPFVVTAFNGLPFGIGFDTSVVEFPAVPVVPPGVPLPGLIIRIQVAQPPTALLVLVGALLVGLCGLRRKCRFAGGDRVAPYAT